MQVLGIETSCDDTAAAVVDATGVLADVIHSQEVHRAYGGVVPELAGRAHAEKIVATVRAALAAAGVEKPAAVAATAGPGLQGAVLVGLCFGKALAAGWDVPFIGVNHLEGHLLSPLLEDPAPSFPFLALVVSGGHTTLYLARGLGDYPILGQTVDDAAGEAWDKVARMMELGYPGGPPVDALAAGWEGDAVVFPRPDPGGLNWSFSGLKTAVRTHLLRPDRQPDGAVCRGFQDAAVDVLVGRVLLAAAQTGIRQVAVSGGVAANSALRARLAALSTGPDAPLQVFLPPRGRCTDNGAMIAHAGRLRLLAGQRDPLSIGARAQWAPGT